MPGIQQIKISLPIKICVYRSTSAGDLPDVVLGPLYAFTSRAWEDHVKLPALAYSLRPRGSVCIVHANFLEAVMTYFFKPYCYFSIAV